MIPRIRKRARFLVAAVVYFILLSPRDRDPGISRRARLISGWCIVAAYCVGAWFAVQAGGTPVAVGMLLSVATVAVYTYLVHRRDNV